MTDRYWNGEQWVYPEEVNRALDFFELVIREYHNDDREWATKCLLAAYEATEKLRGMR
jgi:hypothetical protein